MVTTQVVLDCEATCERPSVCGIYFNTNHTNLSNCAGLTSYKETIRFVLKETRIELPPTWRFHPARLVKLERFVFKETTHTAVPHVDSLSGATWVVTISGYYSGCYSGRCMPEKSERPRDSMSVLKKNRDKRLEEYGVCALMFGLIKANP